MSLRGDFGGTFVGRFSQEPSRSARRVGSQDAIARPKLAIREISDPDRTKGWNRELDNPDAMQRSETRTSSIPAVCSDGRDL